MVEQIPSSNSLGRKVSFRGRSSTKQSNEADNSSAGRVSGTRSRVAALRGRVSSQQTQNEDLKVETQETLLGDEINKTRSSVSEALTHNRELRSQLNQERKALKESSGENTSSLIDGQAQLDANKDVRQLFNKMAKTYKEFTELGGEKNSSNRTAKIMKNLQDRAMKAYDDFSSGNINQKKFDKKIKRFNIQADKYTEKLMSPLNTKSQ